MEWTSLNEIREKYLSFFESKGHLRLPSFSLIPKDDKSLLLINAGMAPMKKYFTGEITPPRKRRIATGSGTTVQDVNRLLKQFEHSRQMMKQMSGKMGKKGRMPFKLPF